MRTITKQWLKEKNACKEGVTWFLSQPCKTGKEVLKKLVSEKQLNWANWLLTRLLKHKDQIRYAVFAAELVIHIYEKKYPTNKKPQQAIEAAKAVLKLNNKKNRKAATAAYAATAADAAYAAADAAAAYAAYAAATAADAAYAAYAAAYAAADAAYAAADAADAAADATTALKLKIIKYGLNLLCPVP